MSVGEIPTDFKSRSKETCQRVTSGNIIHIPVNTSSSSSGNKKTVVSKNEVVFVCEECGQSFQNKSAILSHNKWKHLTPLPNYKCGGCEKTFSRQFHLNRHKESCSKTSEEKNIKCYFCSFKSRKRADVLTHYEEYHQVTIERETFIFKTFDEFKVWKESLEKETKSHFIKPTRTRAVQEVNVIKYICHRDGYFSSRSKGIRYAKINGSNKINCFCPANIIVYVSSENVKVDYIGTHIGHKLEMRYLNITMHEKELIAQKLVLKIPFEQILDDLRDSVVNNELERIHLITRKDLWNIANSYNLNHEAILNSNDYVSVEAWILHMQKVSNLVRFYKSQGEFLEGYDQLKKEDFLLIIMNDAQKNILQKFGNDCVCIDATHGLNPYDFQLYTLMILDDLRQGFPCCLLFSNRGDTEAMKIFFYVIKDCLQDTLIEPRSFMSDMEETFYNAWVEVMGPVQNRIFCSWHVDRSWRKNLNKIPNKEKQAIIYKKIKLIMYEMDLHTFNVMVSNLLNELSSDRECQKFGEYFKTYVKKCSAWAYCYRKQSGINTNMCLENMHRVLKYIYFGGKKVKRLDKAIVILMKFIRDKLFDRLVILNKGKISKKIANIRQTHKKSLDFKNTIVDMGNSWNVSATKSNDIYTVEALQIICTCRLRCQECEICIHEYTCSCIEYSIKWNMCKHIHLVCMFLKNRALPTIMTKKEYIDELSNSDNFELVADTEENTILTAVSNTRLDSFFKKKQLFLDNFNQMCNNIKNEKQLDAVIKHMAPVESIIKALARTDIPIPQTSSEPPNKKIKKQTRFASTKKKRPKQRELTNPSEEEKESLALGMVGEFQTVLL